jgi:hypothetical protein
LCKVNAILGTNPNNAGKKYQQPDVEILQRFILKTLCGGARIIVTLHLVVCGYH